jgi:GT2 family glycosyltransferase/glycosyltransferase involved in cell wall biosynthesis
VRAEAELALPPPDPRHRIAPGVFGWLESPRRDDLVHDCVVIHGWAFSRDVPITRIFARGLGPDVDLECRIARDDVAAVYAQDAEARWSGFNGFVQRQALLQRTSRVEIWTRLRDGRELKLFVWSPSRARLNHWIGHWIGHRIRHGIGHWVRSRVLAPVRGGVARADGPARGRARLFEESCQIDLETFLDSGSHLACPRPSEPRVSVIVALWNRAELTLAALRSVCAQREVSLDVVLVDNASTDRTSELLDRIPGATILRNAENLGFTLAANQGARAARGELLLFLNSDAMLHPGAVLNLVRAYERSADVGAVGGRLIWPNGRLQEAGCVVWRDGACEAFGRNGDPGDAAYGFERDVDFCSGAMLLTARQRFLEMGGFDERYKPAYYEDVDYCVRLQVAGSRVIYTPFAAATHVEFASSVSSGHARRLQQERHAMFVSRHREWLAAQPSRTDAGVPVATRAGQPRALIVDDLLPHPALGAGFPRAAAIVAALRKFGWQVMVYPTRQPPSDESTAAVRRGVPHSLARVFEVVPGDTRFVIVSRPHNMRYAKAVAGGDLAGIAYPVIYDVEAISGLREIAKRRLDGRPLSGEDANALITGEVDLGRGCAAIMAVSPTEAQPFLDAGFANVRVIGYAAEAAPGAAAFDDRRSLLFVGAFSPGSPNDDAIRFLLDEIHPALGRTPAAGMPLVVAGANLPETIATPERQGVRFHRDAPALDRLYDEARVFVAPTRFAAGIPLKLIDAAAHGVPIVCTGELARQLGWVPGVDLLTGDAAEDIARAIAELSSNRTLWQALRQSALARVKAEYDRAQFEARLKAAIDSVQSNSPRRYSGKYGGASAAAESTRPA